MTDITAISQARELLLNNGYENACSDDIFGVCRDGYTLFIEFDTQNLVTRGWMVDAKTFEFVGNSHEVTGGWVQAAAHVSSELEATYQSAVKGQPLARSFMKAPQALSLQ